MKPAANEPEQRATLPDLIEVLGAIAIAALVFVLANFKTIFN